jgi:hypothetical protein
VIDSEPVEFASPLSYEVTVKAVCRWTDDHYEVAAIRVEGGDLTAAGMRAVRWAEVFRGGLAPLRPLVFAHFLDGRDERDLTEAELLAVVYATACALHADPVVEIAAQFGISRSTANKKVIAARRSGYLPKTTQGARRAWT